MSRPAPAPLHLAFDLPAEILYDDAGLDRMDQSFVAWLAGSEPTLTERLLAGRRQPETLDDKAHSDLLVALAPHLEDFLGTLFGIGAEVRALQARHQALAPLYTCKRHFVQRQAARKLSAEQAAGEDGPALAAQLEALFGEPFSDLAFARHVNDWSDTADRHTAELDLALRYAAWALHAPAGQAQHRHGVLFREPHKLDPQRLVPVSTVTEQVITRHGPAADHLRRREGFALTDPGGDLQYAQDQANYCIWCHNQGKDSCSHGLREKHGEFKRSALGVPLQGCPLDERISEMNLLKSQGYSLGALAMVTVDNPMLAGTGHRICNDCTKACIYQKQEPVDIPQVETRTLRDVLELPWGFEIYSLLTRWNPLDLRRPLPRPASGRKVLVAGMGPAGYTLAHHLLNDGHAVVGVDGLKIEPLPADLTGVEADGTRRPPRLIRNVEELFEPLDARVTAGFGGVAEYGITVRWNKNYLKLIRLLLERRAGFRLHGGVRLGGTLTLNDAFDLGFDHVALAMGAGRPRYVDVPNGLARGVRQASDFLMGLQLTGAARRDSIANLQLRLPALVIGGGLTAIDTATEALAYYPLQVEKFLTRYETLCAERGQDAVRSAWDAEEQTIADEFIAHARAIRAEREAATAEARAPRILELLKSWGGATLVYRRRLVDAPCYTLNHEEVLKALEEGVEFAECLAPSAVQVDAHGHLSGLEVELQAPGEDGKLTANGQRQLMPARAVLVAAGTVPNTVLQREAPTGLALDGGYFRSLDENGEPQAAPRLAKSGEVPMLTQRRPDGRAVSFFGDLHPSFAGNVVKAMASAKRGYPVVSRLLAARAPASQETADAFQRRLHGLLRAHVERVQRLTPTIVEVVVHAPLAAQRFEPGQFYRLQNFETLARRDDGTTLAMEGLALTGAWVDRERGLVALIVLEMGGSSDLCAHLTPGEPVVLMGPTGAPTEIPAGETVLLAGGGLGNAVLLSIGKALRQAGSRVVYFAGYKHAPDRYRVADIEAAADVVVWTCDQAPGFTPGRAQDRAFTGNIVQAMRAYAAGELGEVAIALSDVDRIIAIGSDRMMAAVTAARHAVLAPYLKPHVAIGSINSPMQCMMKEVCAQCLQGRRDPASGRPLAPVFTCFNQDQPLDEVDFACLGQRLRQNGVQEKLTAQWIDRSLRRLGLR
ncbi:MAG: FAD-dependent oxidoreductase [Immundisolibacter sp.]|uniref:FAD-dependent oxidoreductase n=1 Tax=Immundisolibacter sp. TaxID=1934948 RepID=UPI0019BAA90B|nr:FAD-dependent oxidoreductase [Immundisolibacter sp.]MBC7161868.1 FAD-dependent oxidoreductase [Immundisolibacter sp.]